MARVLFQYTTPPSDNTHIVLAVSVGIDNRIQDILFVSFLKNYFQMSGFHDDISKKYVNFDSTIGIIYESI